MKDNQDKDKTQLTTTLSNVSGVSVPGKSKLKKIGDYKFDPTESGKLGQGSFGVVYKGRNSITKEKVAIKQIILSSFPADFERQLVREVKITKIIDHPNVVKFYDVLKTDTNLYLISEYCNGGDLEKYIKKKGTIPEEEAVRLMRHSIAGYHSLYEKKIVHRDIKPSNLIFKDGVLKISDFGFAKIVEGTQTEPMTILGTPMYMAPDIMKGNEAYDNKCDVWAFGFVFYEMLYGKTPWTGGKQYELYSNIIKIPLSFPEKPEVSDAAKEVIEQMLKIKPAERMSWEDIFEHPLFKKKVILSNKSSKLQEELSKKEEEKADDDD